MLLQQIVNYSVVTGRRLRLHTVLLVLKYCLSTVRILPPYYVRLATTCVVLPCYIRSSTSFVVLLYYIRSSTAFVALPCYVRSSTARVVLQNYVRLSTACVVQPLLPMSVVTAVGQAVFKFCGGDFGYDFRCSFLVYFNYIPTFFNYSAVSSLQKEQATIYCDADREYKHYCSKELIIWSSWTNLLACCCPVCCTLHHLKLWNLLIFLSSLLISISAACLLCNGPTSECDVFCSSSRSSPVTSRSPTYFLYYILW